MRKASTLVVNYIKFALIMLWGDILCINGCELMVIWLLIILPSHEVVMLQFYGKKNGNMVIGQINYCGKLVPFQLNFDLYTNQGNIKLHFYCNNWPREGLKPINISVMLGPITRVCIVREETYGYSGHWWHFLCVVTRAIDVKAVSTSLFI